MHDDISDLDDVLSAADKDTLAEIIRQAEIFLDAQLQSGIAADQRATTFASIMFAVIAVALGAYVTAAFSTSGPGNIGWIVFPSTLGLLVSATLATHSSRPVPFYYAGSNPRHWRDDVLTKAAHSTAMAGQAKLYAKGIVANTKTLQSNSRYMTWAIRSAGLSLLAAVVVAACFAVTGTPIGPVASATVATVPAPANP